MAETYALTVQLDSHEYHGEFYLMGEGYATPAEILEDVASDHLLRIADAVHIEEYLLDVLNKGQNASKDEYDTANTNIECWIHVDVAHRKYAFGWNDTMVRFPGEPTENEIATKVEDLRS